MEKNSIKTFSIKDQEKLSLKMFFEISDKMNALKIRYFRVFTK